MSDGDLASFLLQRPITSEAAQARQLCNGASLGAHHSPDSNDTRAGAAATYSTEHFMNRVQLHTLDQADFIVV